MIDWRRYVTEESPSARARVARGGLRLLSLPYGAAVRVRNALYGFGYKRTYHVGLPVVSVGNLSVGGTGKSPMVAWLARRFRSQQLRVAILSRGYGQLDEGQNDEALELELQLPDVPHLQHWDRLASAKLAEEELQMQLLLLDDGFQHRRLARDLDIVLLDATDSQAAGWLLPGGLLREPFSSLHRADAVVLSRADQVSPQRRAEWRRLVARYAPRAVQASACHRPATLRVMGAADEPLERLRGKKILAFCGIGNPDAFFRTLQDLGAEIVGRKVWPDHFPYQARDVEWLEAWSRNNPEAERVLCTLKDWVKIQVPRLGHAGLAALTIELAFLEGQVEIEQLLQQVAVAARRRE